MDSINGLDIKQLAEEFGTPVYIYDCNRIKSNYNKLKGGLDRYYPKNSIHYSLKANSNLRILEYISSLGAGADCSSPIELELARLAGFDSSRILYTGNYESEEDLQKALELGVRINLDDISSFNRLIKFNIPEILSFRINPGIGKGGFEGITTAGSDAKFGVPYEMAYDAYKLAKDAGVKRFGIHMMTGSNNLEPYYFAEIVEKLMTIAGRIFVPLNIQPEYVDIGGGLGVPYYDDEKELDIDLTAKLISEALREKSAKFGFGEPELILEPGRFIIADAGFLISKITGVKKSYKTFVGLDAGMNTLIRPALYGAYHKVDVYGKNHKTNLVTLCGQICENSDIFAKNLPFPEVEDGDIVIFHNAGAYGYSMSSNYNNRLRPAEVMILNGEPLLIRKREIIDDILNGIV